MNTDQFLEEILGELDEISKSISTPCTPKAAAKPAPVAVLPTPEKKSAVKADNTNAAKAFAVTLLILLLIGSICLTAYMNHETKEALNEANSIISSASLEAEEIIESANEEASEKIADAKAEAEKIKEETA